MMQLGSAPVCMHLAAVLLLLSIQGDAAVEPAAAADGEAVAADGAVGLDQAAHANPGTEQPVVNGNPGVHAAEAAAVGNPGHGVHANPGELYV
jgi:hypothetical protein